jgi:hypothetical protein
LRCIRGRLRRFFIPAPDPTLRNNSNGIEIVLQQKKLGRLNRRKLLRASFNRQAHKVVDSFPNGNKAVSLNGFITALIVPDGQN